MASKKIFIIVVLLIGGGFFSASFVFNVLTKQEHPLAQSHPSSIKDNSVKIDSPLSGNNYGLSPSSVSVEVDGVAKADELDQSIEGGDLDEKEFPSLVLNGIFYSKGGGGAALINNRVVEEGSTILGVKILRIFPRRVEIDFDGRKRTLAVR